MLVDTRMAKAQTDYKREQLSRSYSPKSLNGRTRGRRERSLSRRLRRHSPATV